LTRKSARRAPVTPKRFPPPSISLTALLTGGSDREFRQLVDGLVGLSSQIRSIRALLAEKLGVSLPQYNILMALARIAGEDGTRMSDVAQYLGVSLAFIVIESDRLRRKGMLSRQQNPEDRRSVIIALTPKARHAITDATPYIQRINNQLFRSITTREMRAANAIISRVLQQSDAILRSAPKPAKR
jgi:MarR family transcriptional regulator, organic hydroperoxide resistance regulator